jgi:hypothetical protein
MFSLLIEILNNKILIRKSLKYNSLAILEVNTKGTV